MGYFFSKKIRKTEKFSRFEQGIYKIVYEIPRRRWYPRYNEDDERKGREQYSRTPKSKQQRRIYSILRNDPNTTKI